MVPRRHLPSHLLRGPHHPHHRRRHRQNSTSPTRTHEHRKNGAMGPPARQPAQHRGPRRRDPRLGLAHPIERFARRDLPRIGDGHRRRTRRRQACEPRLQKKSRAQRANRHQLSLPRGPIGQTRFQWLVRRVSAEPPTSQSSRIFSDTQSAACCVSGTCGRRLRLQKKQNRQRSGRYYRPPSLRSTRPSSKVRGGREASPPS
jgi:hypothetical protein